MHLVDSYLAVRRAMGFKLRGTEGRLRSFAQFAEAKGDTHVRVETAVESGQSQSRPHRRTAQRAGDGGEQGEAD